MTRPLTLSEKIARLLAANPGMSYSQACSELAKRRRARPDYGRTTVTRTVERECVESPRFAWQERKDLE